MNMAWAMPSNARSRVGSMVPSFPITDSPWREAARRERPGLTARFCELPEEAAAGAAGERAASPGDGARHHQRLVDAVKLRAFGEDAGPSVVDLVEDLHAAVPGNGQLDRQVVADRVD